MADINKNPSPLVKSVVALDNYFSELERIGDKIIEMEMKTDFDFDQAQRLMSRFAECGEGVSTEVTALSLQLNESRERADKVAKGVAEKAQLLNSRREERQKKMESFRVLGEKVRDLSNGLVNFQRPEGETLTDTDRAQLKSCLNDFEVNLTALIDEARALRKDAQDSRMKSLEQNADALSQTLVAIQQKIKTMDLPAESPDLLN